MVTGGIERHRDEPRDVNLAQHKLCGRMSGASERAASCNQLPALKRHFNVPLLASSLLPPSQTTPLCLSSFIISPRPQQRLPGSIHRWTEAENHCCIV